MAQPSRKLSGAGKVLAFSVRLYSLFLRAYPAAFRHTYEERMIRVFSDTCRATLQQRGVSAIIPFWLHMLSDLVITACLERWRAFEERGRFMATSGPTQNFPLRLWVALVTTLIAVAVALVASLNLYLLEDGSPLTQAAYSASALLRFSYDGIYLSALAAGVAICAIVGYAVVQRTAFVVAGLIGVTLLVAFGGFGGMLVRHPLTFLIFFVVFLALILSSLLLGQGVSKRAQRFLAQRSAAILGACVGVGGILLVNVTVLVVHTLILNPVSHALYMQGQIEGTHLNFTLIAMGVALLTLLGCVVSLGLVFRVPS